MDKQEGNDASSSIRPPKKRLKILDPGLTLFPGQTSVVDDGLKSVQREAQTFSDSDPTSSIYHGSLMFGDLLCESPELPSPQRKLPPRPSSSQQKLHGSELFESTTGGSLKGASNGRPTSLTSVCDQPASVRPPPFHTPTFELPHEASIEHIDNAFPTNPARKHCVSKTSTHKVPNANHVRPVSKTTDPRRAIDPIHSRSLSHPATTLQPRSPTNSACFLSKSCKPIGESHETSANVTGIGAKQKGRNSRSWTKHFPSAVAKTPFPQKTSLLIFPGPSAKTSPAHSNACHLSSNLHLQHIQPKHSFYLRSRTPIASLPPSRRCNDSPHGLAKTLTPKLSAYQQAQRPRRSSSLPAPRSAIKTTIMNSLTADPQESALMHLPDSPKMPSPRDLYLEPESCIRENFFQLVSPPLQSPSCNPAAFFLGASGGNGNALEAISVQVPRKEFYSAEEYDRLKDQLTDKDTQIQSITKELESITKECENITQERDKVFHDLKALSHTHGRLDAASKELLKSSADLKFRNSTLLAKQKETEKKLAQTNQLLQKTSADLSSVQRSQDNQTRLSANEPQHQPVEPQLLDPFGHAQTVSMPVYDDSLDTMAFDQALTMPCLEDVRAGFSDASSFAPLTTEQNNLPMNMGPIYSDNFFPGSNQIALESVSASVSSNVALNDAGNAAAPIDLTNSPASSSCSSTNSGRRAKLSQKEQRENKLRSNQVSRENAAYRKQLQREHPNNEAYVEAQMAKRKTLMGRPSKVGKSQMRLLF